MLFGNVPNKNRTSCLYGLITNNLLYLHLFKFEVLYMYCPSDQASPLFQGRKNLVYSHSHKEGRLAVSW